MIRKSVTESFSDLKSVAIVSRVILALFWFAIQTANGGQFVQVMISAIWPSFGRLHNSIPADQDITTAQMVSFFLCQTKRDKFLLSRT